VVTDGAYGLRQNRPDLQWSQLETIPASSSCERGVGGAWRGAVEISIGRGRGGLATEELCGARYVEQRINHDGA
jgi:hypothetical protein